MDTLCSWHWVLSWLQFTVIPSCQQVDKVGTVWSVKASSNTTPLLAEVSILWCHDQVRLYSTSLMQYSNSLVQYSNSLRLQHWRHPLNLSQITCVAYLAISQVKSQPVFELYPLLRCAIKILTAYWRKERQLVCCTKLMYYSLHLSSFCVIVIQ